MKLSDCAEGRLLKPLLDRGFHHAKRGQHCKYSTGTLFKEIWSAAPDCHAVHNQGGALAGLPCRRCAIGLKVRN